MKYEDVRKRLIKESGMISAAIVVLAAAVYYFGIMGDDYQQQKAALQNQVSGIRGETTQLQDEFDKIQKNSGLYREAMEKNENHQLTISRQVVRDHFSKLRNRYYLNNMHLTMSPIVALADSQYKRKTGSIESSDVVLTFEAVSDEYVYDMLNAMQQELPGSSEITELMLTHTQPLTDLALQTISQTGTFALVTGQMKFSWFGLTPKESDNADTSPKK